MKVAVELDELRNYRRELDAPFGLVPTMGYLHEGHLSLVRRAREQCASVGVSIFVNPTQFAPSEDLESYPRDLEHDLGLLEDEGVDLVWTPTNRDVYPEGAQTWVEVEELTKELEGKRRLGHFRGVTTVVAKLFNAFEPDKAFFGQKDAQQAVVIQRMVKDLLFSIDVVVCPIVREEDGLAMSSRNTYLTPEQRQAATALSRALRAAESAYKANEKDAGVLRQTMMNVLDTEPLAEVQYVSAADPQSLRELEGEVENALLSMAVYVGETRLIDNVVVGDKGLGIRD
jgi:pantoate--beta-alanine ligase